MLDLDWRRHANTRVIVRCRMDRCSRRRSLLSQRAALYDRYFAMRSQGKRTQTDYGSWMCQTGDATAVDVGDAGFIQALAYDNARNSMFFTG